MGSHPRTSSPRVSNMTKSEYRSRYGTLTQTEDDTVEFWTDGQLLRTWKLADPIRTVGDLFHHCLTSLGNDGWRPISHQGGPLRNVILARVPYTAGSKLATFGTLRFVGPRTLVLSVAGSVMKQWEGSEAVMSRALVELEREGWRIDRKYDSGAVVVRG